MTSTEQTSGQIQTPDNGKNNNPFYRFFIAETSNTALQAARYFLFGAIPTAVDMGLLWLLRTCFGEELLLLWTGISFVVATYVTYLISIRFVFNSRNVSNKAVELAVFFGVRACGLGWTELLMWLFARKFGMHYMLAKFIIVLIVFVWNFAMNKILLFRNKKQ